MRLPFLRAKPEADASSPARARSDRARSLPSAEAASADVAQARTRARQRLVGALALLAVGVVGFPLLFETQPRPLPVDIPIRMPAGEMAPAPTGAAPSALRPLPVTALPPDAGSEIALADPAASAAMARAVVTAAVPSPAAAPAPPPVMPPVVPPVVPAVTPPAALSRASAPAVAASARATTTTAAVAARPAASVPNPTAARPVSAAADGARAAALLAGAASAPAGSGRFVVQVGAYTDARTLKETRSKVEKLGLQTYTQVVENDAGKRTRVRLGPYATRDEAEAAAAKLKRAGLPANILAL